MRALNGLFFACVVALGLLTVAPPASAQVPSVPATPQTTSGSSAPTIPTTATTASSSSSALSIDIDAGGQDGNLAGVLKITFLLLALSLLPAMLVSVTSFTRIVIVLGFLKQALGTQNLPPSQVIIGLSLFLCLFTMSPVISDVHQEVYQPYSRGEMTDMEALEAAVVPMRRFMAQHTRPEDLRLFLSMTQDARPESFEDVSTLTLIPAFMLSELRTAFLMGALLYLPFVIIDLVVSAVLMSMGMMMVPPLMVSLPIKLLLFVLADGWNLVIGSIARSFVGV
jgi:flagellar biosynthetic protein FliP